MIKVQNSYECQLPYDTKEVKQLELVFNNTFIILFEVEEPQKKIIYHISSNGKIVRKCFVCPDIRNIVIAADDIVLIPLLEKSEIVSINLRSGKTTRN